MGRWRIAMIALCAFAGLLAAASFFGSAFGWGGVPRIGLWGMELLPLRPYTFVVTSLDTGQAAERAGIRPGDEIDMRAQSTIVRMWLIAEPVVDLQANLKVMRDGRLLDVAVAPLRIDLLRRPDVVLFFIAVEWMLAFAALLAWRKPESYEIRLLSLTLIFLAISYALSNFSAPSVAVYVVGLLGNNLLAAVCVTLWAMYCGCFARPLSTLRRIAQTVCVAFAAASAVISIGAIAGELTLAYSTEAYLHLYGGRSELWHLPYDGSVVAAIVCSVLAMAASRGEERQRSVWALVPLALLFGSHMITSIVLGKQITYDALLFWIALRNFFLFVAPIGLTYAALGRRLLDVGFVLNRALIFGLVSVIIVGVFVLVEWAASEWIVSTNHAAGTVFSMVVALALGLSMRFIHRQVDRFVDRVFFWKRHEDEAELRRFAREASYITDRDTLVQRTIGEVREHANAATVSLLVSNGNGRYVSADKSGYDTSVSENDRALVALRTWHKRVDLDTLDTVVAGEYAYPMISRGQLVGALVCGPKTDGDSYAPDELNALSELAHGVGTALHLLEDRRQDDSHLVIERLDKLDRRIDQIMGARSNREPHLNRDHIED
jgi:hypothetical protein